MVLQQHVSHLFMGFTPAKKVIAYQANYNAMSPVGSGFINNSIQYSYANGQIQITAVNTLAIEAESGNKTAMANLKKAVKAVDKTLCYWALIVDAAAMGDPTIIKNASFTPTTEISTPSVIFNEMTLDYEPQKGTGTILLKVVGMKSKSGFINYYTGTDVSILKRVGNGIVPNVAAIIANYPETHKHILISGLVSGSFIQAVVVVTNSAGTSQMTNIVNITVP